jgi:hypothetical protein
LTGTLFAKAENHSGRIFMNNLKIWSVVFFTSLLSTNSFADLVDCEWYYNNVVSRKNTIQKLTSDSSGNNYSRRIMNVQKQAVDHYLGIRFSSDPQMLAKKPSSDTHDKVIWAYCAIFADDPNIFSGQGNIYVGFSNQLHKDLFYEMLKSDTGLALSIEGYSDSMFIDEVTVSFNGKALKNMALEMKLAEQMPKLFPRVIKKIKKAIEEKRIKLSEIDGDIKEVSEINPYLQQASTNPSINEFIDIVGQYKKTGSFTEGAEYYNSLFAYLLYLKKLESDYLSSKPSTVTEAADDKDKTPVTDDGEQAQAADQAKSGDSGKMAPEKKTEDPTTVPVDGSLN